VAPGIAGNAIREIALQMDLGTSRYAEFFRWANAPDGDLSPLFPATLLIHERLRNDPEMDDKVRGFWAGEKLPIADVRQGMRQIGQWASYPIRNVPARELPHQRFTFVTRLIRAAGFRGWVLLFDEVELIGKYTRLQRARSYAELTRWMGQAEAEQYPGLTAVATITDDYVSAVLVDKQDLEHIGPLLLSKDTDIYRSMAGKAETGMRVIQRDAVLLEPPDDTTLQATHDALRRIYSSAYGWMPNDLQVARTSVARRMRSYVRRWINEWDLQRLYPGEALQTVETELRIDYAERPELQPAAESDDDQAYPDGS
jgi:bacteriophage exclusion system BrxC/D-like protein